LKKIFLTILVCLPLFFSHEIVGQTAWLPGLNGKVTHENGWKVIRYEGTLSGTDTLISAPFNLSYCDNNFRIFRRFTQNSDSVSITAFREENWLPGTWRFLNRFICENDSANVSSVYYDTMKMPLYSRLVFIGTAGNGKAVNIKVKILARFRGN